MPPADKQAYHGFIKALMTKLVETYGEEKVLSWRFRVGSEISLNAITNEGWEFIGWEGDVISTDNALAITVSSDMDIKAIFTDSNMSVSKYNLAKKTVFPNRSLNGGCFV